MDHSTKASPGCMESLLSLSFARVGCAHTGRLKGQLCPYISSSLQPKPQKTRLFSSPFPTCKFSTISLQNCNFTFRNTRRNKHLEIVNSNAATKWEKHCYLLKKGGVRTHRKKQWESSIIIVCYTRKTQVGPFQLLSWVFYLGDCKAGACTISGWNQHTGCSQLIFHWELEQAVHLPSWHNSSLRRAKRSSAHCWGAPCPVEAQGIYWKPA